jgi:hypothetical protein
MPREGNADRNVMAAQVRRNRCNDNGGGHEQTPFTSSTHMQANAQLTDGGPSGTSDLPIGVAGPPFGAAPGVRVTWA